MWEQPRFRIDSDRPLRTEPVQRDEVYIGCGGLLTRLGGLLTIPLLDGVLTMPLGTYRLHGDDLIGDPALWQPLLDELAADAAKPVDPEAAAIGELMDQGSRQPVTPKFCKELAFESVCPNCGVRFLAHYRKYTRLYTCSNRCHWEWPRRREKWWRERDLEWLTRVNAARTAKRAEARAGRQCAYAHCDNLIDADRSTKRFCSDRCRVAHHRADKKEPAG